jgi:site-specific recombinase XerD
MAAEQITQFTRYMSDERGFSPATISSRLKTIDSFLLWVEPLKASLPEVSLADVDRYLTSKGREGWKRVTVATAGQTLRTFFKHAEQQGWCQPGIATGIELPRVYGMEHKRWRDDADLMVFLKSL